jgi:DNA-binding response OmpR family regulator
MNQTAPVRLLYAEDEAAPAALLHRFLASKGFEVLHASDGQAALQLLQAEGQRLDAALLDIMLPGHDGHAILRFIRQQPQFESLPVLFLTARDREHDEIAGLELGADDYIAKPASFQLILTRLQAVLRRRAVLQASQPRDAQPPLPFRLDADKLELHILQPSEAATVQILTPSEAAILGRLVQAPDRVFSRDQLLDTLPGESDRPVMARVVDTHIKNLRHKLGPHEGCIRTIRGRGYGFEHPEPASNA